MNASQLVAPCLTASSLCLITWHVIYILYNSEFTFLTYGFSISFLQEGFIELSFLFPLDKFCMFINTAMLKRFSLQHKPLSRRNMWNLSITNTLSWIWMSQDSTNTFTPTGTFIINSNIFPKKHSTSHVLNTFFLSKTKKKK